MITGKQRSYLKSLAHKIDPVVMIGKQGVTEAIIKGMDDYLTANELMKVKVSDKEIDVQALCGELAVKLDAEFVQAIGHKFVLYRMARNPEKRKIVLPKKKINYAEKYSFDNCI